MEFHVSLCKYVPLSVIIFSQKLIRSIKEKKMVTENPELKCHLDDICTMTIALENKLGQVYEDYHQPDYLYEDLSELDYIQCDLHSFRMDRLVPLMRSQDMRNII